VQRSRSRSFNNKSQNTGLCLFARPIVKNNQSITPPTTGGSISLRRNYFRVRSNTLFFHPFQSLHHTHTVRVLVWTYSTGLLPALFPCSILTLVYVCTARTYSTSYRSLSYVVPHPHVVSCHTVRTIRVPNILYRRKRPPESCPIILASGCFRSAPRSSFFYSKCRLA
jgi:hypothetical protein